MTNDNGCLWCDEDVLPDEPQEMRNVSAGPGKIETRVIHHECAARSALGSVGHQAGRCSCYGGTDEDPPGMTKREAARAAQAYAQNRKPPTPRVMTEPPER